MGTSEGVKEPGNPDNNTPEYLLPSIPYPEVFRVYDYGQIDPNQRQYVDFDDCNYLSTSECARIAGIELAVVSKAIANKKLKTLFVNFKHYITSDEFVRWRISCDYFNRKLGRVK